MTSPIRYARARTASRLCVKALSARACAECTQAISVSFRTVTEMRRHVTVGNGAARSEARREVRGKTWLRSGGRGDCPLAVHAIPSADANAGLHRH